MPSPPDFADLDAIANAIAEACPDAGEIAPLSRLGEGWFSVAVETAGGVVFRLGTGEDVSLRHEKEFRVLPWLGEHLPLPIPNPRWRLPRSETLPFGGIGYPKLAGKSMLPEVFARGDRARILDDIAGFLVALHRAPVQQALALGVPDAATDRESLERARDAALPELRELLHRDEYDRIVEWWERYLDDPRLNGYRPVLVHADATADNVLVDEQATRVLAVIDFEHLSVSDPARDFAQFRPASRTSPRYLGEDVQGEVMERYRAHGGVLDGDIEYRTQRSWERGAFYMVFRAVSLEDGEEMQRAIRNLRRHGILPARQDAP